MIFLPCSEIANTRLFGVKLYRMTGNLWEEPENRPRAVSGAAQGAGGGAQWSVGGRAMLTLFLALSGLPPSTLVLRPSPYHFRLPSGVARLCSCLAPLGEAAPPGRS